LVPSALLSFEVWALGTVDPQRLRFVTLAIHLLSCLLGYHLLNRWLGDPRKSAAVVIIAGLHGAAFEVVTWEACQAIAIAGCFALLAATFLLDLRKRESHRALTATALVLSCFAAMTSYEAAVGLPLVLILLDRYLVPADATLRAKGGAAWLLSLYPVYGVMLWINARDSTHASYRAQPLEALSTLATDFLNYIAHTLAFFPAGDRLAFPPWFLGFVVIPVAAFIAAWLLRQRFAAGGLVAFVVFLSAPLVARATVSVLNRPGLRQLYLPLVGLAVLLAVIPGGMTRRRSLAVALACVLSAGVSLAVFVMRVTPAGYVDLRQAVRRELASANRQQPILVVGKSRCESAHYTYDYHVEYDARGRRVFQLLPLGRSGEWPTLEVVGARRLVASVHSGFAIDLSLPANPRRGRAPALRLPDIAVSGTQRTPFGVAEVLVRDQGAIYAIAITTDRPLADYVVFLMRGCGEIRRVSLEPVVGSRRVQQAVPGVVHSASRPNL
jgi:hypothetical protein